MEKIGLKLQGSYKKLFREKEVETYKFRLTDETIQTGFKVKTKELSLDTFKENPIVLYQHNSDMPVGRVLELEYNEDSLIGYVFISERTELGREVKGLLDDNVLNAVSIGFMPKNLGKEDKVDTYGGELLELSIVSIPNNRNAIRLTNIKEAEMPETNELNELKKEMEGLKAIPEKLSKDIESLKDNKELTELKSQVDSLKSELVKLSDKKEVMTVSVKDNKFSTLGDAVYLRALASFNNVSIESQANNLIENNRDANRERWLLAAAFFNKHNKQPNQMIKLSSYNLSDIADGASLVQGGDFTFVEDLIATDGIAGLGGVDVQQLIGGRATFTRAINTPRMQSFNRNGTNKISQIQGKYEQITLTEKEIAGKVIIENNALRNAVSPEFSRRISETIRNSYLNGLQYYLFHGNGSSNEPVGLINLTGVTTEAANGSVSAVNIGKDLRKLKLALVKKYVPMNLSWVGANSTRVAIESQYDTNSNRMHYAATLEDAGRLIGLPYSGHQLIPGASTTDLFLLNPQNIALAYSSEFVLQSDMNIDTDQTIISAITGYDMAIKQPTAVGKLTGVQTWEA